MHPLRTYRIETNRLVIRCCEPGDTTMMLESITASIEHLRPWMTWAENEPVSLAEKTDFLRQAKSKYEMGVDNMMCIFDSAESVLIGCTGLHPHRRGMEIGYWIDARQIGKGYATEAAAALTKVALEVENLERIGIHCDINNKASSAIPQKLGYRHETTLLAHMLSPKGMVDEMVWSMGKAEYGASPAKHMPIRVFDAIGREIY